MLFPNVRVVSLHIHSEYREWLVGQKLESYPVLSAPTLVTLITSHRMADIGLLSCVYSLAHTLPIPLAKSSTLPVGYFDTFLIQ